MSNIKYWYIGGDIHGDWRPVRNWVVNELKTPKDQSALILLGDVGANYYLNHRDRDFKQQLNKLGIRIYCLRGNHEMRVKEVAKIGNYNHIFDGDCEGPVYIEKEYPNIYYLCDYGGIYMFNKKECLVVPGAYSVDKEYRILHGWSWFSDEQLNGYEREWIKVQAHDIDFDYILAHTCPYSWEQYINDLFLTNVPQYMIDKTMEYLLDDIIDDCSYKHFYFGHFHDDRNIPEVNATMLYKKIIPLGEYIKENVNE